MRAVGLSSSLFLMLVAAPSWAFWLPAPPLVVASQVNTQTYTNPPRPLTCFTRAVGVYWDPVQQANVSVDVPDSPECQASSLSAGYNTWPSFANTYMASEPWSLYTINGNWASTESEELGAFVNTTSGAGRWYVVEGAPGTVALRIDIALQGLLSTYPDGNARGSAFLTHVVTVIASPSAELRTRATVVNRGVPSGGNSCVFGINGTIADECYANDGTSHDVNVVVRSNPFQVEVGVPFYVGITNGAAAGAEPGAGYTYGTSHYEAFLATSSRFPTVAGLTAEGFVLDGDGDPVTHDFATLGSAGYTITAGHAPTVDTVAPASAAKDSRLTTTIRGRALARTATATLTAPGEDDVIGVVEDVDPRGRWLRARFELGANAVGARDVVVTNDPARVADTTAVLPSAIALEELKHPEVRVDLISPTLVELWGDLTIAVKLTNLGNVDAHGTLVIDGIPKRAPWTVVNPSTSWTEPTTEAPSKLGKALMFPPITVPPGPPLVLRVRLGESGLGDDLNLNLVWEE